MRITNPSEVPKFVRDAANQSATIRTLVAQCTALDIRYFQGHQWGDRGGWSIRDRDSGGLNTNYNPDSSRLRATNNWTTQLTIASAAATDPENIEVQVGPPARDGGVEQMLKAQCQEETVNALLGYTKFLNRAKHANFMRCVIGAYGIGYRMAVGSRNLSMGGTNVVLRDQSLTAFTFHPLRLIIDPFNPATDLRDHDWVIFEDVWTIQQLRRLYPNVKWDTLESEMVTVGNLATNEITANEMTGRSVFQQYAQQSQTKGARVYQIHLKDETGRFSQMWCGYSLGPKYEVELVNADDPNSPFGGDGLPLAMLYGHPRPESQIGISDVGMMRDDQDKSNLAETWRQRIGQKYAGYQWIVDKRWFGKNVNDSDMQDKFTNTVAGIIPGDPRSNDKSVQPPQLITTPQPPAFLNEMTDEYTRNMGRRVFVSELSQGMGLKSHQPDAAVARVLAEGERVAGIRVQSDIIVYQQLAKVGLGTVALHVQQGNPSTLAMLRREGFDEQDLMTLLETDPYYPACEITIPESSVRRRSTFEKKAALDNAAQLQQITPEQYQQAAADLDLPVTEESRHMRNVIQKWVASIIRGMEWQPKPLGTYTSWFLNTLRLAYGDKAVQFDPEADARITRAIQAQEMLALQQQMQQTMAENPPAPGPAQAAAPAEQPQPTNIAEMIEMMAGSGAAA